LHPPLRVLTYLHSFEPGGLERDVLRFNRAWRAAGVEIEIVLGRNEGALAAEGDGLPYTLLQQPGARSTAGYETLWMIRHLPGEVRRWKPDIVFCAGNSYTQVSVALKLALGTACPPIVYRVSNDLARRDLPAPARWLHRQWQRLQSPVFARVVAMAEPARAEIIHEMGMDPARVVTIDNASMTQAETERLAHARDATTRTRPGRHYLAVGRLAAQKNFRLLIDAFARIATPRDSLTIVGEGADRGALERQAAALGVADRLAMPGHINPIDPYLAEADALVLSSDYEGLGIVVIEALAAGLPVVATDCGPNMAMLVEGAGRLVPIRNAAALSMAMTQIVTDVPDVAAMRARARHFTVEATIEKWLDLFEDVRSVRA
jgi:glycosyltransferase involved in cell wall biosynthesis